MHTVPLFGTNSAMIFAQTLPLFGHHLCHYLGTNSIIIWAPTLPLFGHQLYHYLGMNYHYLKTKSANVKLHQCLRLTHPLLVFPDPAHVQQGNIQEDEKHCNPRQQRPRRSHRP